MDAALTNWDENWSEQLIQVFKCLLGPNFRISDDSVLHLLLDNIKTIVSAEELIQTSEVEWFVASVLDYKTTLSSLIISFAVRLVGWLGETERWFVRYRDVVEQFLSTVCKETSLLQDFSVASAVYESLTKIGSHDAGLTWILLDLGDFVQESYSLLTSGSSVFVDRAIVGFLATAWTNSAQWSGESSLFSGFTEESLKHICHSVDTATNKLRNCSHASNTKGSRVTCIPVLQVIEEVCNRCDILCNKILNSTKLYQNITDLIMDGTEAEQRIAVNILKIFMEKSSDAKMLERLEQFTDTLYTKERIKMAQDLTLCFLRKGYKQTRVTMTLLEPIKLALTDNNGSISSHFTRNTSKSKFLDRLCHCIACLEKTDLPVTTDVLRLFKMTCDVDLFSQTQISLFSSSKLQRTCLNYLHQIIETGRLAPSSVQEVTSCLLEILKSISVDCQIYDSCLNCLLPIVGAVLVCKEVDVNGDNVGRKLKDIIQCHLCSVQWEIRDTTLEFLCQLLEKYKDSQPVLQWFTSSSLHVHTWQCLSDSDSYVRASAITCISKMVPVDLVWQSLMTKTGLTETEIITKVTTILQSDSEAFARRAAVKFIHSLYCHKVKVKETVKVNYIMETLVTSSSDFDWEVKLEGLELIQTLISEEADQFEEKLDNLPSYAEGLFKMPKLETSDKRESKSLAAICKLHLFGCWKALFLALDDYDQTVCEKANKILTKFSHKLKATIGDNVCEKISVEVDDVVHEQFNELERNKTNLVVDRTSPLCTESSRTLQSDPEDRWQNGPVGSGDYHISNNKINELCGYLSFSKASLSSDRDTFKEDILKVIEKIMDFEPPEKVSNDNYETNPFSLLEDILSYAQKDEESNVVDCY